jgi:hypothetical protein
MFLLTCYERMQVPCVPSSTLRACPSHSPSGKKTKFGGLGTTKASEKLDFAEGGLGEAARIKQLSYDRQREEEEEKAKKLLVRLWHMYSKPRNGD